MFKNLPSTEGLSLDRLKNFLAFADVGSIVGAAGNDHVRQSLFSRQIGELERFFSIELTKRQGRGKGLTEAGRRLAAIVREQFGSLDEFAREAKSMPASLSIVAPNSIATWLLLPRLTEIRRRLPQHRLILHHEQTPAIVRGVLEGRHDIGLLRETALPRTLKRRALGNAGFALFVPRALAGRLRPNDPAGWLRLPLALPVGGALRASVDRLAAKHGIELVAAVACDSYVQAAAAVESGAVASVLPVIAEKAMTARGVMMKKVPELGERSHKTLMIWSKRVADTRASVSAAVEVFSELLSGD